MKNEQELMQILGQNVKTHRERRKWSQEYLAEKAGVSKNAISDIETGQKFARAKTLVNLAKAFETDVYELLKPDDVSPDKAVDIILKYSGKMRSVVEKFENDYILKIK